MNEIFTFIIIPAMIFALGIFVGVPSNQQVISYFKNGPICTEKTVRLNDIKKCYNIQEVGDKK